LNSEREVGFFDALMMGLGGAIGFEIFVLLDYPYFDLELGASIVFGLLLAGLVNFLIMLNYCELSTAIPEIGGAYTYMKRAFKGFVPFIFGCFRWLASVVCAALAAITFTRQILYISKAVPFLRDFILTQTPFICAIVVIVMAVLGIKGKKGVGTTIVFAFIAIFAVFVGAGLFHGLETVEVFPRNMPSDIPKVFAAAIYVFPMFFGVRSLVAGAAAIKDPGKNLPRAIILSSLLIIPLYICVVYVAAGLVPFEQAGGEDPLLNLAGQQIFGWAGGALIAVAGMVASLSALGTSLAVQSSILRGMSRDAYLPKIFHYVNRRSGTQHLTTLVGSFFVIFLSAVGAVWGVEFLAYAASFGSLLVFAFVNLSLLRLRREQPYIERPFKTPLYPFTPIAGVILSAALLVFPMLLGDANAQVALATNIGLTVVVLMTYYFRMVGLNRLQIATGGACIGIGVYLLLSICLRGELTHSFLPSVPYVLEIMFAVSVVFIVAGFLNVTTRN